MQYAVAIRIKVLKAQLDNLKGQLKEMQKRQEEAEDRGLILYITECIMPGNDAPAVGLAGLLENECGF